MEKRCSFGLSRQYILERFFGISRAKMQILYSEVINMANCHNENNFKDNNGKNKNQSDFDTEIAEQFFALEKTQRFPRQNAKQQKKQNRKKQTHSKSNH